MQHVIDPVKGSRPFYRANVGGFFNNAHQAVIPGGARAVNAWILIGDAIADGAESQAGFQSVNSIGKLVSVLRAGAKDVEGIPLGSLGSNTWQLA